MKRQAYGFRDKEFFKLKTLAIHETKVRFSRIEPKIMARINPQTIMG